MSERDLLKLLSVNFPPFLIIASVDTLYNYKPRFHPIVHMHLCAEYGVKLPLNEPDWNYLGNIIEPIVALSDGAKKEKMSNSRLQKGRSINFRPCRLEPLNMRLPPLSLSMANFIFWSFDCMNIYERRPYVWGTIGGHFSVSWADLSGRDFRNHCTRLVEKNAVHSREKAVRWTIGSLVFQKGQQQVLTVFWTFALENERWSVNESFPSLNSSWYLAPNREYRMQYCSQPILGIAVDLSWAGWSPLLILKTGLSSGSFQFSSSPAWIKIDTLELDQSFGMGKDEIPLPSSVSLMERLKYRTFDNSRLILFKSLDCHRPTKLQRFSVFFPKKNRLNGNYNISCALFRCFWTYKKKFFFDKNSRPKLPLSSRKESIFQECAFNSFRSLGAGAN